MHYIQTCNIRPCHNACNGDITIVSSTALCPPLHQPLNCPIPTTEALVTLTSSATVSIAISLFQPLLSLSLLYNTVRTFLMVVSRTDL